MTIAGQLTGKVTLAYVLWALATVCAWAAPNAVQEPDTSWHRWVQLDSAAVSAYAPLLPSEQITLSLWLSLIHI